MGHSDVAPSLCEAKCQANDTIMILYSHANKTHFHKKGCAFRLILKVRDLEFGSGLLSVPHPVVCSRSILTYLSAKYIEA